MFPEPEMSSALADPDPPSNVVPLAATNTDPDRAERARRNGARSRGPVTTTGKARSARNALKHGLTARHGVVLDGEDEPAFRAMAERLLSDLAPAGELAAFLAGDLAAAIWRTGRARRLERQAFAGDAPDPEKLNLALRYGGSASRELYRALRALDRLGHRPASPAGRSQCAPAAMPTPAALDRSPDTIAAENRRADGQPGRCPARPGPAAHGPPNGCRACLGCGRPTATPAGLPAVRPVPSHWSRSWYRDQADAFPGAEPVAVAADGTIHALEDGAWVVQPPHLPPGARPPAAPTPAAEQAAVTAILAKPPTVPTPAVSVAHRSASEPKLAG